MFSSRHFASSSESVVPCAVRHCHGGESHHRKKTRTFFLIRRVSFSARRSTYEVKYASMFQEVLPGTNMCQRGPSVL
jgi:hypothetical protein